MGVGDQRQAPAAFFKRLDGLQGRPGRVRKISRPPGFRLLPHVFRFTIFLLNIRYYMKLKMTVSKSEIRQGNQELMKSETNKVYINLYADRMGAVEPIARRV
jgi:hypothetical protein